MRLVFAGTPEVALPSLRALIDSTRHEVVAVVTRPDAPAGRGRHLVRSPVGDEVDEGPEGCLSIPGYRWDCRRHLHVVASGWNMHGDPVRVEGSELLARAIQHETDHLDGVLFVDRLDAEARAAALAALAEAEWAGMAQYLPVPIPDLPVPAPVVKVSPH